MQIIGVDPIDIPAKKTIRVAVGVILQHSKICISLRPKHLHKGGFWEFPGGKIEEGETPESALTRELYEELGIRICGVESLMKIPWEYPEKNVLLEVMKVTSFEGQACGQEGQEVKWIRLDQLSDYQFPEANQSIVDGLLDSI